MQFPNARILIFSRVPRAGQVKTRLIPLLGEAGASDFHAACLQHTLQTTLDSRLAPVELWLDERPGDAFGTLPDAAEHCRLRVQCEGDLGQRMAHAVACGASGEGPALLVGTDTPLLDADYLARALQRLDHGDDVVMGPAEDGGYVLLGLWRDWPSLFRDVPWGGERVAAITRERCRRQGLELYELPTLWDMDRPEDIVRLCRESGSGLEALQALACQHLPRL